MPSWSSAYVEQHNLTGGHSDTINHISFSPDGLYLASCGDDNSLIIWNVEEGRLLYRLLFKAPVDSAIWHPTYPGTLIVGCDNGYLFQLHDFSPRDSEQFQIELGVRNTIQSMAYEKNVQLLAVGVGTDVYVIREVKQNCYEGASLFPPPPHSEKAGGEREDRLRPVGVHFVKDGERLLASYLVDGIVCWDTRNRNIISRFVPDAAFPYLGSSALSPDGEYLAMYNMSDGVHVYAVKSIGRKRKPRHHLKLPKVPRTKHTLQVTFINEGCGLVCGTTTGDVCVWDSTTGDVYQALIHDRDDVLQAIAGVNRGEYTYVAAGSTDKGQSTYIKIWRAKYNRLQSPQQVAFSNKVTDAVRAVTQSNKLTRPQALLGKWIIAASVVVMCLFLGSWICVTHALSWTNIQETCLIAALNGARATAIGVGYIAATICGVYYGIREWLTSLADDMFEAVRMKLLLWLRLDELLVPRLPPA